MLHAETALDQVGPAAPINACKKRRNARKKNEDCETFDKRRQVVHVRHGQDIAGRARCTFLGRAKIHVDVAPDVDIVAAWQLGRVRPTRAGDAWRVFRVEDELGSVTREFLSQTSLSGSQAVRTIRIRCVPLALDFAVREDLGLLQKNFAHRRIATAVLRHLARLRLFGLVLTFTLYSDNTREFRK